MTKENMFVLAIIVLISLCLWFGIEWLTETSKNVELKENLAYRERAYNDLNKIYTSCSNNNEAYRQEIVKCLDLNHDLMNDWIECELT